MFDFEFDVSESMFFKQVRNFRCTVDDKGKLVDDEKLKILNRVIGTNATILFPR